MLPALPLVYDELRQLAANRLARESGAQTLQPTALVHEAWLKQAKERGCLVVSRLEMFARQAAPQFERFTGKSPPVEIMRTALRQTISPLKQG